MDSRHSSDQQKFKDAGEQAARVIGEFMAMANDFSKRFESGFSGQQAPEYESRYQRKGDETAYSKSKAEYTGQNNNWHRQNQHTDDWQTAGEYLRELRETAGYTIDSFAKAMNRQNAASKIKSVEAGRDVFPNDWLDQISALLKQNDPMEFFEKLRSLYEQDVETSERAHTASSASDEDHAELVDPVVRQRREALAALFTDESLEGLSDSQFEELSGFIKTNYQAALQLVRNK